MIVEERLRFVDVRGEGPHERLCDTVFRGLSSLPKTLPPRLFYDHAGSELFEAITDLPEYYPTRTEAAILERHAVEIVAQMGPELSIMEFGSGSSRKTRLLIEAALGRQESLEYVPIDISRAFLRESSETLLAEYPRLNITALAAEYFDAARAMPPSSLPRLILFLGSNIGNLAHDDAIDFLSRVRRGMKPHDRMLVGTDLVKSVSTLEAAYDDAQGVTAQFNLNLLARINRELGGNFDLDRFQHRAPWDSTKERIEMRLVSLTDQAVRIEDLDSTFQFAEGEAIVTEWSQKYTAESFASLCEEAGLRVSNRWLDDRGWFAEWMLCPISCDQG